jgi:hypothetical protein
MTDAQDLFALPTQLLSYLYVMLAQGGSCAPPMPARPERQAADGLTKPAMGLAGTAGRQAHG